MEKDDQARESERSGQDSEAVECEMSGWCTRFIPGFIRLELTDHSHSSENLRDTPRVTTGTSQISQRRRLVLDHLVAW